MPDLPSRAELFEVGANDLLVRAETRPVGKRITPEQVYTPGSDINLVIGATSAMVEEVMRQLGRGLSDLTLDGATGEALDRWVADRYSPYLARLTASPAYCPLTFTRTSLVAGAVTYLTGSIVQTTGGVRFELREPAVFGVATLGPVTVSGRAVEAGTSGNVAIGTVTSFVTEKPDPTLLLTNLEVGAGGTDTQSDESYRSIARQFWKTVRRGTLSAIEFGALSVPGVVQAFAEEQLSQPMGVPNGFIFLYIADVNGQSNTLLNTAVDLALMEYRCGGIVVTVYGATPTYQPVSLDLSYEAGIDTVAAWSNVRAAVVAAVNGLRPGETLEVAVIIEAAKSVTGVLVADDAVVAPTGDVVPTTGQIIRTSNDLVTPA